MGADAVVVATGGRVVVPEIRGADQPHVLTGPMLRHLLAGELEAAEAAKLPAANVDGQPELQRNQDLIDRLAAGLGVYYRAANGTTAGVSDFVTACTEFARYGPAGWMRMSRKVWAGMARTSWRVANRERSTKYKVQSTK